MPGLFGVLTLGLPGSMSQDFATNTLRTMASCLGHENDTVLTTQVVSSHGLAIGRISLASTAKCPWPNEIQSATFSPTLFMQGVLFEHCTNVVSQAQQKDTYQEPDRFLRGLNGYYSLVLCSKESRGILIAVDRRASEPIFYIQERDLIFFAPEVKALLAVSSHPVELNAEAIPMLLSCGHLLGEQTLVSTVKRLPGGCYLRIEKGRVRQSSYWSFLPGSQSQGASEELLKEELQELIKQSVIKNMESSSRTAIFLSGGVDSRGILAGALAVMGSQSNDLRTVSWGLDEGVAGSDPNTARRIATQFNIAHKFFPRMTTCYGKHFEQTNYIIDGLSDMSAFHPYEFTIMRKIKESGYERVFRGDEIFGWHGRVYTHSQAETEVALRPLRLLPFYSQIIEPRYYSLWSASSDAAMANVRTSIQGMEPNDAKDYLYFSHRLQGYLHTAAYYKQVYLDHRNILLEDSILEFLARVPSQYRLDKGLFRKTVHDLNPMLFSVPIANRTGYENWGNEFVSPSPLREYTSVQLNDSRSGIWEYFNRHAMLKLFDSLSLSSPSTALREEGSVESLKSWAREQRNKTIFGLFPRFATELRARRSERVLLPYVVILRFLVLKNWFDLFVEKSEESSWRAGVVGGSQLHE